MQQYRRNWKEHVHRMSSGKIPKEILKCQAEGKISFKKTF
jgi:hypothetical protein